MEGRKSTPCRSGRKAPQTMWAALEVLEEAGLLSLPATGETGIRTATWPHPGACRRKLRRFRSGVGPAVGGGRKAEGTMRGSEIRGECRLERPFLRWGPGGAGGEGGAGMSRSRYSGVLGVESEGQAEVPSLLSLKGCGGAGG